MGQDNKLAIRNSFNFGADCLLVYYNSFQMRELNSPILTRPDRELVGVGEGRRRARSLAS